MLIVVLTGFRIIGIIILKMKIEIVSLHVKCMGVCMLFFPMIFWSLTTFIIMGADLPEHYD